MPRVLLVIIARILLAGAACLAFAGCSSISGTWPSTGDLVEEAGTGAAPRYELVDIDPMSLKYCGIAGRTAFLPTAESHGNRQLDYDAGLHRDSRI